MKRHFAKQNFNVKLCLQNIINIQHVDLPAVNQFRYSTCTRIIQFLVRYRHLILSIRNDGKFHGWYRLYKLEQHRRKRYFAKPIRQPKPSKPPLVNNSSCSAMGQLRCEIIFANASYKVAEKPFLSWRHTQLSILPSKYNLYPAPTQLSVCSTTRAKKERKKKEIKKKKRKKEEAKQKEKMQRRGESVERS